MHNDKLQKATTDAMRRHLDVLADPELWSRHEHRSILEAAATLASGPPSPAGEGPAAPAGGPPAGGGGGSEGESHGSSNTRVMVTGDTPGAGNDPGEPIIGLHWIRAKGSREWLCEAVRRVVPGKWEFSEVVPRGRYGRTQHVEGPHGIRVFFGANDGVPPLMPFIDVPGSACDALGPLAWVLLRCMVPADVLRIDVAIDGWKGPDGQNLSPGWLNRMIETQSDSIRSRIDRDCISFASKGYKGTEETLYLGSKMSPRFVRIYNKRGFTRIETQMMQKHAAGFADALQQGVNIRKLCFGVLRDHVDFVVPGHTNISRAPLQEWWSRVVEQWDKVRITLPTKINTIHKVVRWKAKQCAATFATLVVATGCDVVAIAEELYNWGLSRMKAKHWNIVEGAGLGFAMPRIGSREFDEMMVVAGAT